MADRETAQTPEDITRLFVERSNASDADGVAALYEPDAVMAFPPGQFTVGRDAIRDALGIGVGRDARTSSRRSRCPP